MKCPSCSHTENKVVDSRSTMDDSAIRRRRECTKCGYRFTTYEYIEKVSFTVVKRDGRREPYDRQKLMNGIILACNKLPISSEEIEKIVQEIEDELQANLQKEVPSKEIGETVMKKLHLLNEVAYIRFASVYRQFKDVKEFKEVLDKLLT